MAFWNTRDDDEDEALDKTADELESAATGLPPAEPAEERGGGGFSAPPLGLLAAFVVVLLVLAFFFAPTYGYRMPGFSQAEPWVPQGDAVYASQRLADIAAQQQIADARSVAWEDVPAVDAHAGTFAAQIPPR
jgi:hypothetical protein